MRHGELCWLDGPEPRPVLCVHADGLAVSPVAITAGLTDRDPGVGYPLSVHLPADATRLEVEAWVLVIDLYTVDSQLLTQPGGLLPEDLMTEVEAALLSVLQLSDRASD